MAECPTCHGAMLSERPHVHEPRTETGKQYQPVFTQHFGEPDLAERIETEAIAIGAREARRIPLAEVVRADLAEDERAERVKADAARWRAVEGLLERVPDGFLRISRWLPDRWEVRSYDADIKAYGPTLVEAVTEALRLHDERVTP